MCLPWNVDLREAGSVGILKKMCRTGTSFFSFQKLNLTVGLIVGNVSYSPPGVCLLLCF